MQNLWEQVLNNIREKITPQSYKNWVEPTKILSFSETTIEIGVPNVFYESWFQENYLTIIKETMKQMTNRNYDVVFKIGAVPEPSEKIVPEAQTLLTNVNNTEEALLPTQAPPPPPQRGGGDILNPKYTFENFVVGASNQFAHAASYAASEQPAGSYNPLFIFGGVGLGKTHLLNAIGNHILKKNQSAHVCYISSERFMNELINCLRYEKMETFRKKYRDNIDVLLMDDIQFLAGKDRTQEEFFHTFNTLHSSRKQIVVTSDKFPKDIEGLEDRLRTRFEWGLIADLQPPEMETRIAILKNKAESDDIYLPDDVAIYLATHIKSNVRELEGSLIRLGAFASLTGMEISVDLAREVLKNLIEQKDTSISLEHIQKSVSNFYNVKVSDLKSKAKLKVLSHPRQVAMYFSRKYTQKSFPEIGKLFGGKDHSTVMHAVRKISKMITEDPVFKKDTEALERIIIS